MLNPETRNIVKLKVDDVKETGELIEMLMGRESKERKEFLEKYGQEAKI